MVIFYGLVGKRSIEKIYCFELFIRYSLDVWLMKVSERDLHATLCLGYVIVLITYRKRIHARTSNSDKIR